MEVGWANRQPVDFNASGAGRVYARPIWSARCPALRKRRLVRLLRAPRLFLLLAVLEEIDPNFLAIDPSQFAATVGQAGRREQQEKLLERKSHN